MIPTEVLAHLATRASTLEERLVPPFQPAVANDAGRIEACIDRVGRARRQRRPGTVAAQSALA